MASNLPERVRIATGGRILSGWLDLPSTPAPHPAIILVHGSGPTNLEQECRYVPIREAFTQAGIACLMWDKPGCGHSEGELRQIQSYRERMNEVAAAIEMIERRPDIDASRIGLWGISEGVWISTMVARQHRDVQLVILVSGPSSTLPYAAEYIARTNLRLEGYGEAEIDGHIETIRECFRLLKTGASYGAFLETSEPLRANSFFQLTGWNKLGRADWEDSHSRENLGVDTRELLVGVTCPVLAIFGEKDTQVDWRRSKAVHEQAFIEAGNTDFSIMSFAEANHNLRSCGTGSVRESRSGGQGNYVQGYVEAMVDWLKERCFTSAATMHSEPGQSRIG